MIGPILSEEQVLLKDSAAAWLREAHDAGRSRAFRAGGVGHDPAAWATMGQMGWLALRLTEQQGGLGLGIAEGAIVARELGRAGAPDPYVAGCLIPSALLAAAAGHPLADSLAAELAEGRAAISMMENDAPLTLREGRLDGAVTVTGDAGDRALLIARDGDRTVLIAPSLVGLARESVEHPNGARSTRLHFAGLAITEDVVLLEEQAAEAAWSQARSEGLIAIAQQLAGLCRGLLDMTVAYTGQRVQFDRTVSSFQAIQHKLIDLHIAAQLAESAADKALAAYEANAAAAWPSLHAGKARGSDAAMDIARAAIQLHGAIGYTDESSVGPYVRLAMTLARAMGTASHHRQLYWRLTRNEGAARD